MIKRELTDIEVKDVFGSRLKKFQKLMKYKIRDILLVSSLYDNYLFEEDGRLYELIREEYHTLNLSHTPEIVHVTTGVEGIELISNVNSFDLIISTMHIEDMHVIDFAKKVKKINPDLPIVLLAYDNQERKEIKHTPNSHIFDRFFIWQGDYRLLMGIIKYIEDKKNIENDTSVVGVQAIILVEDDVKFYSQYLPLIYTQVFKQSQRLISEGVNTSHRFLRMRARPKILLCTTYEEAWEYFEKYQKYILGIISDVNFPHKGVKDPEAGLKFAKKVKELQDDIPILLQSSQADHASMAQEIQASFLQKTSPTLLADLKKFLITNFGFGDFVFKMPDGTEVSRSKNLKNLEEQLAIVPDECIAYHSERNHFSNWLKARTEFWLAQHFRPKKISDFQSVTELRNDLISNIKSYQELRQRGTVTEFDRETFDPKNSFARIGGGSLGGKARGLGFINSLIVNYDIENKFDGVEIYVPSAVVLATDVFDSFLEENELLSFAISEKEDKKIIAKFLEAEKFPSEVILKLIEVLSLIKTPLAVRSSSLLEDSQFQPFAGVYQTYMIPNKDADLDTRLEELLQTIKLVYASTFLQRSKDYLKATSYRLEEEKMAVIIQKLVGTQHNERFYPDIAGVAKSYNFYPISPQKSQDGIALVALGLGKTVVEGGNTVRFCPRYPKHLMQFFTTKETIKNAQQNFFALNLEGKLYTGSNEIPNNLVQQYKLEIAEKDNTLFYTGSTYSPENDAVYDGISRSGTRVVTFAPILKHNIFPLPQILELILNFGTYGMGTQVEIEFALNMSLPKGELKEFAILQMRPMVMTREASNIEFQDVNKSEMLCSTKQVLGDGIYDNIRDVIVVDREKFERSKSKEIAYEIAKINEKLVNAKRPYILIGVGRWGSTDPWLGIPVSWDQISGASVIIEAGFKDFSVTPSQGSHFFHNITSFGVGYFTIAEAPGECFIDWDWLAKKESIEEYTFTRHLRFDSPLVTKISGQKNKGVIYKPKDV
ncbi:MAG: PEP/pyruvate-binding domain-containing protein [Melioribacteraceae bacterium]